MNSVRLASAMTVAAVLNGRSLDDALLQHASGLGEADQSLLRAIAYGVVREWRLLDALLGKLMQKPLRNETELHSLLLCGLFQLRSMRIPAHAAVAETVNATAELGKPWARGLANAVLRRFQREAAALEAGLDTDPALRQSCPDWLAAALRRDWPQQWMDLLINGNLPGPLTLRVNRRHTTRADYGFMLEAAGMIAAPLYEDALVLAEGVPVTRIPGFAEGLASVQDASAQLACGLLDAQPGMRVLDACSAPGGKAAHLLERIDGLSLTALDSDAQRLQRVQETLQRLGLQADIRTGDAARPADWWDGQPYQRILLDAPCSGTGVIRRHPDIKWLRRETDIPAFARQQGRLLRGLWPLLAPGGVLLYATCSVLRAEGEAVVTDFLGTRGDARELPIEAAWGEACNVGRRIATGGAHDGFYYARLVKTAGERDDQ